MKKKKLDFLVKSAEWQNERAFEVIQLLKQLVSQTRDSIPGGGISDPTPPPPPPPDDD